MKTHKPKVNDTQAKVLKGDDACSVRPRANSIGGRQRMTIAPVEALEVEPFFAVRNMKETLSELREMRDAYAAGEEPAFKIAVTKLAHLQIERLQHSDNLDPMEAKS